MSSHHPSPSVLVIHGALGSKRQMHFVTDALATYVTGHRVESVELPGHGHTPLPLDRAFTMHTFVAAVHAAITTSGLHRPVVFGYSMGGYVALLLESQYPGLLGGIVTLGTMMHWTPEIAAMAARRLDPVAVRAKVPAFAEQLAERHAEAGGWELLMTRTADLLRGLGDDPPLTNALLTRVHCPVHLLVGARDDTLSFEDAANAAAHLPHARASLLDEVPHPIEKVPLPLILSDVADLAAAISHPD